MKIVLWTCPSLTIIKSLVLSEVVSTFAVMTVQLFESLYDTGECKTLTRLLNEVFILK